MNTLIASLLAVLAVSSTAKADTYETPRYTIEASQENIEVRNYPPVITAQVETTGSRSDGDNQAFMQLFRYISGDNVAKAQIAMTVPVTRQSSDAKDAGEKIAMTVPVTKQKSSTDHWTMSFIMPANYTLQTLPVPLNKNITFHEKSAMRAVAIRFNGFAWDSEMEKQTGLLQNYIQAQGLKTKGNVMYAFYDSPWTLPWMRRNEVMYTLAE